MILLVSYDLKAPGRDYESLYEVLKSASSWWHYLESTWLLYTSESVKNWADRIKGAIDENDNFIVVDITKRERQGWLEKEAWDWISKHEN
jgi:hypothetical protein